MVAKYLENIEEILNNFPELLVGKYTSKGKNVIQYFEEGTSSEHVIADNKTWYVDT